MNQGLRYMHKVGAIMRIGSYLIDHSVVPGELLLRLELSPSLLLRDQVWLERRLSLLLTNESVRCTGDLLAGAHTAQLIRFQDYGRWGAGILAAKTLLDAVTFACREMRLIETGTRMELHQEGTQAHLSFELIGEPEVDPRHFLEGSLVVARKLLDLAVEPVPAEAQFPHPRILGLDLEPVFGQKLRFRRPRTELVFDREALRLPLRPMKLAETLPVPSRSLLVHDTARSVIRAMEDSISFERPTTQAIAAALSINVRRMQRRLAEWGVTFEDLLDEHRLSTALEYLRSNELSITQIAFRLGYSDSAHFTRAFRRWTGKSPREVQNTLFAAAQPLVDRRARGLKRLLSARTDTHPEWSPPSPGIVWNGRRTAGARKPPLPASVPSNLFESEAQPARVAVPADVDAVARAEFASARLNH